MKQNSATKCENVFCLYWKNGYCRLKNIELNISGICTDCIYVDISSKTLNQKREEQFEKLEGKQY